MRNWHTNFKAIICRERSETLSTGNSKTSSAVLSFQFPVERVSPCSLQIIALKVVCQFRAIVTKYALVSWESFALFSTDSHFEISVSIWLLLQIFPCWFLRYFTTIWGILLGWLDLRNSEEIVWETLSSTPASSVWQNQTVWTIFKTQN